ncbi:hypothetical protein [Mycobacteroides franklinii]|uniref:hypothetical protein n=1 Tax=Mycobacteroides franklinii TaxID=948102 RepID=UPI0013E8C6D3
MKEASMLRILTPILLVLVGSLISAPFASADVDPQSPEGCAILKPALTDLDAKFGQSVQLVISSKYETFRISDDGRWAFVYAKMRNANGGPVAYLDPEDAEAAKHGAKSQQYAGLLQRGDTGQWTLITSSIGPTDVPWVTWSRDYSAPPELFPAAH